MVDMVPTLTVETVSCCVYVFQNSCILNMWFILCQLYINKIVFKKKKRMSFTHCKSKLKTTKMYFHGEMDK